MIDAMIGLINFGELRRYYHVNRPDWVFFMGAMLGILFLGIIQGILIGVVLSLLALIARASKPGSDASVWTERPVATRTPPPTRGWRRFRACSSFGWTGRCSLPTLPASATPSTS